MKEGLLSSKFAESSFFSTINILGTYHITHPVRSWAKSLKKPEWTVRTELTTQKIAWQNCQLTYFEPASLAVQSRGVTES